MADTIEEMDSELKHFGVKGMKWGVKKNGEAQSDKKQARLNARADKGDALITKAGGGQKALNRIGTRRIAVAAGSIVLNKAASAVFKDKPAIAKGVQIFSNYANAGMAVKDLADANRVLTAEKRTRTS